MPLSGRARASKGKLCTGRALAQRCKSSHRCDMCQGPLEKLQLQSDAQSQQWDHCVSDLADEMPAILLAGQENHAVPLKVDLGPQLLQHPFCPLLDLGIAL